MPAPRLTLIDCDPGTDDAIALWLALASPELDVRLVTVGGGNVGLAETSANARAVLALAGAGLPVLEGAQQSLMAPFRPATAVHGSDGLAGVRLPPGPPPAPGLAADGIRALLRASAPASVTVIGLGPVTNLALAFATEPALADRLAEIVLMGGSWAEGNITPSAEFNVWNDPEALAILAALGRPLTLATLDLTAQAFVTPAVVDGLDRVAGGACWAAARAILRALPPSQRMGFAGFPLHDPCAVAWAIAPDLFTLRDAHLSVDCGPGEGRGRTVIDRWGRLGLPANCRVLETLDAPRFFALLAARVAALP